MPIKLHRCSIGFLPIDGHACHRVQKALDAEGVDYEVVKAPLRRPKRTEVEALTGQQRLPVIELEDGTAYRAESAEMASRISEGRLGTTA